MNKSFSLPESNPAVVWNTRFASDSYVFGTEPNEWLMRHAGIWNQGARILSVADGEGRNSVWLAKHGYTVDAFDISEVGVSKAQRLALNAQVSVNFTVAGCDEFLWRPDHYDGIAAIFIQFADPELRSRIFQAIVRSLRPGGTLVLMGYTPKQLEYRTGGPSALTHLYTEVMLRSAFSSLDIQILESYETDLAEGSGHQGRSAVIGLVASKPLRTP